jgi:hypothetical protein
MMFCFLAFDSRHDLTEEGDRLATQDRGLGLLSTPVSLSLRFSFQQLPSLNLLSISPLGNPACIDSVGWVLMVSRFSISLVFNISRSSRISQYKMFWPFDAR